MNSQINLDEARKRLLWRAMHRGMKEMDIIIGGFAQANLGVMNSNEINELEGILEISDQDLLSYATGQVEVPAELNSTLLTKILNFRPPYQ